MPSTTTVPQIGISFNFPLDTLLLIIFLCILAAYIIFSVILHYHWVQYSASKSMTLVTFVVFAVTTVPLMILLGLAALAA